MQFQVPQFIETEDKIVGPLTLKQFFYVGAAGGISTIIFFMVQSIALWMFLSLPIIASGLALAFLKPYGRSLPSLILAAFRYYWSPQVYVWQSQKPQEQKLESSLRSMTGKHFSLEDIVSGFTLKNTWRSLQTRAKKPHQEVIKSRYARIEHVAGDQQVVRRVDYR